MAAESKLLSIEQVLKIHDDVLRQYGGTPISGHRGEEEGVTAAVSAAVNSYYSDLFELAAAYAICIVMGHVFGDGNKRTAKATALTFLKPNGISIRAVPEDLRDLMVDVQARAEAKPLCSASELVAHVAAWLRARAIPSLSLADQPG